jgi:hypothetical protein
MTHEGTGVVNNLESQPMRGKIKDRWGSIVRQRVQTQRHVTRIDRNIAAMSQKANEVAIMGILPPTRHNKVALARQSVQDNSTTNLRLRATGCCLRHDDEIQVVHRSAQE